MEILLRGRGGGAVGRWGGGVGHVDIDVGVRVLVMVALCLRCLMSLGGGRGTDGWRGRTRGAVGIIGFEVYDTLLEITQVVNASLLVEEIRKSTNIAYAFIHCTSIKMRT
jgi:hypothetical protein